MKIRYSLGLVALVVACGGSSKHETNGKGDDGGSSGESSGTSGSGGSSKGGSGGTTSRGGTSGNGGASGSVMGGDAGSNGGGGDAPPMAGYGAGPPGAGGDFGGTPGTGAVGGTGTFGQICNEDGCFFGDPNVKPIDPPGPIHCGGKECGEVEACCNSNGKCFNPDDDSEACPRPPDDDDQEGRRTCTSSAHCDPQFYCALDYGQLCGGVGHCQPITNCGSCGGGGGGDGPNPCRLCGCDGNTYPNVQTACLARASIAYSGAECGETVQEGGVAGSAGAAGSSNSPPRVVTPCGTNDDCTLAGEVCCAITNRCYPTSDPGQCAQPPEGTRFPCTSNAQCQTYEMCVGDGGCDTAGGCVRLESGQCGIIFEPACGCDGTTYTSADCATQSGVRVNYDGECLDK